MSCLKLTNVKVCCYMFGWFYLQDWSKIQCLISKRGKESLKRRVADFDATAMLPDVTSRVLGNLSRYDLETVQMASVGAATFYQWVSQGIRTLSFNE